MNILRDALEARVLNALRHNLMQPELFQEFCDEFTREMNRLRMEGRASIDAAEAEIRKIDRELDKLMKLILASGSDDAPTRMMKQMKNWKLGKRSCKRAWPGRRSRLPCCTRTWRIRTPS